MCDPAELELGRAQDEAIDLAESKQRIAMATLGSGVTVNYAAADLAQQQAVQRIAPKPSVVRAVHYVAEDLTHRAAHITEVADVGLSAVLNVVGLCVMNPDGLSFPRAVPFDPTGTVPGTYHWPEIV